MTLFKVGGFIRLGGWMILLLACLAGFNAGAAQPPVDLRCALRVNPLGIGNANPRLSWQLQGTPGLRGETQSAYQIQVGSTPGAADLWDSGKVVSGQTIDVLYAVQPRRMAIAVMRPLPCSGRRACRPCDHQTPSYRRGQWSQLLLCQSL